MRSQYATDVSSGFLEEVHGALSAGSGWGTNGAGITVPRRHLNSSPAPPARIKSKRSRRLDAHDMFDGPPRSSPADYAALPETLSDALRHFRVPHAVLDQRYGRGLGGTRALLGVAPGALALLEIFPPALRTFSVVVPSLACAPHSLLPGLHAPPSRHVALAMYFASRSARCTYSTLTTCAQALRRGAAPAIFTGGRRLTAREAAVAAVAAKTSSFPPTLSYADRARLHSVMSRAHADAVVLAIAMSGLLNLTMTALVVDIDRSVVDAASGPATAAGWTSGSHRIVDDSACLHFSPLPRGATRPERRPTRGQSLRNNLSALAAASLAQDKAPQSNPRGVPKSWPAVGDYLVTNVGHSFPIFSRIRSSRATRALASALCMNLDETECSIDVEVKYLAAVVYATMNGNHLLSGEFQALAQAKSPAITKSILSAVINFASDSTTTQCPPHAMRHVLANTVLTVSQKRLLYVAKACSMSPPVISPMLVKVIRDNMLPPQIVELVTWLGLMSTFHRLYVFYFPNCLDRSFLHESTMVKAMDDDDVISDMS